MSNLTLSATEKFSELLNLLKLERIIVPRLDFCLQPGFTLPVTNYKTHINRSNSEMNINEHHVSVSFGFEVKGIIEEKTIFIGHYHYHIVYKHSEMQTIQAQLEDEEVKKMFLFTQSDKLVWSYFRKTLQDMVVDAGLAPLVLPLYR